MLLFGAFKKIICLIISTYTLFVPFERQALGTATHFTPPASVFMAQSEGTPLIAAHRSGKGGSPENTLKAVKECVENSEVPIDMFEIDIQITLDGELVLYHSLYLDENSDAAEYFGNKNIPVFSKTYADLRQLNMGEFFRSGNAYPYQGLRGDDIPDDLRLLKLSDFFDYLIAQGVAEDYLYSIEIKYPFPWGPSMVNKLYTILHDRNLTGRAVIGSYWADVTNYIDKHYAGKLHRFASIMECLNLYRSYYFNEDLSGKDIPYAALSLPYYEDNGYFLAAKSGEAGFIDYMHQYGLSACYWTVNDKGDVAALTAAGADVIMTDYPANVYSVINGG